MSIAEIILFACLLFGSIPFGYLFAILRWPALKKSEEQYVIGAAILFGMVFSIATIAATIAAEFILNMENLFFPIFPVFFVFASAIFFAKGKTSKKAVEAPQKSIYSTAAAPKTKILVKEDIDDAKRLELKKLLKGKPLEEIPPQKSQPAKILPEEIQKPLKKEQGSFFSKLLKPAEKKPETAEKEALEKTEEKTEGEEPAEEKKFEMPFVRTSEGEKAEEEKKIKLSIGDFEKKILEAEKIAEMEAERQEKAGKKIVLTKSDAEIVAEKKPEPVEKKQEMQQPKTVQKISLPAENAEKKTEPIEKKTETVEKIEKIEKKQEQKIFIPYDKIERSKTETEQKIMKLIEETRIETAQKNGQIESAKQDSEKEAKTEAPKDKGPEKIVEILKKKTPEIAGKTMPETKTAEMRQSVQAKSQPIVQQEPDKRAVSETKKQAILKLLHELKEKPIKAQQQQKTQNNIEQKKVEQANVPQMSAQEKVEKSIPSAKPLAQQPVPRRLQRFYREGEMQSGESGPMDENADLSESLMDEIPKSQSSFERKTKDKETESMAENIFDQLEKEPVQAPHETPAGYGRKRFDETKNVPKESEKIQQEQSEEKGEFEENPFAEEKDGKDSLSESELDLEKLDEKKLDLNDLEKDLEFGEEKETNAESCPHCGKETEKILFCSNCGEGFCPNCAKKTSDGVKQKIQCPGCGKEIKTT